MTTEATFWQLLKRNTPLVDWQRMETGVVGKGVPDLNGRHPHTDIGLEVWVELKHISGNKVTLRPEQVGWHKRRWKSGSITRILVRQQKNGPRTGKIDRIYLWPGCDADKVFMEGTAHPTRFVWDRPFKWKSIEEAIFDFRLKAGAEAREANLGGTEE